MEADLKIDVGGETFEVHSIILMMASPVFRTMLTTSMSEASSAVVKLPGKEAAEFRCFYDSLSTATFPSLTNQRATFLSRWADEYEVSQLKERCEVHLMEHAPVDGPGLEHAITHGLEKRVAQCVRVMKKDLTKHMDNIVRLVTPSMEEHLRELWPTIARQAGLSWSLPMPAIEEIKGMWPFVIQAVKLNHEVKEVKPKAHRFAILKESASQWPGLLFAHLPRSASADEKGRTWLQATLREYDLF